MTAARRERVRVTPDVLVDQVAERRRSNVPAYYRDGVPYNAFRQRLAERTCAGCAEQFLSVASNGTQFCSPSCCGTHAAIVGKFSGRANPRWRGGVSAKPMRYKLRSVARYPERDRARRQLACAIRIGTIVRPDACTACGSPCRPHAHHDDYARPLEARWLCRECHREHHEAAA